jgi:hypothetical protein
MRDAMTSRSRVYSIINACKEARAAATSLRLHAYYRTDDAYYWGEPALKNYINLDVDTIWLFRQVGGSFLDSENIQWQCALCDEDNSSYDCVDAQHKIREWSGPRLAKLAINNPAWLSALNSNCTRTVDKLNSFGALELLLVVGDFEAFEIDRDIMFIAPQQRPLETRHATDSAKYYAASHASFSQWSVEWSDLANEVVEYLQDFKKTQLAERQKTIDGKYAVTGAEILAKLILLLAGDVEFVGVDNETCDLWTDLEKFEVPKVRFVEAMKKPSQWVRRLRASRE